MNPLEWGAAEWAALSMATVAIIVVTMVIGVLVVLKYAHYEHHRATTSAVAAPTPTTTTPPPHHPTHTNGGWWGAVATSLKSVLKKTLKAGLVLAGIAVLIWSVRVAQLYSEDRSATLASGERAVQIENGRSVRNGGVLHVNGPNERPSVEIPGDLCVRWTSPESGVIALRSQSKVDPLQAHPTEGIGRYLHFIAPGRATIRFEVKNPVNGRCQWG